MKYFAAPDKRKGDGFLLRSYFPGDGPKLCKATNASYEHLEEFMPWATNEQTDAEAEKLARTFRARWLLAEDFVIGIWAPDESELWGGCGFHLREGGLSSGNAEIGMWIAAAQAGRGLGTRVLEELIDWGFSEWPWVRLSWRCDAQNAASIRLAEKAGLRHEGTHRGHLVTHHGDRRDTQVYAILKHDRDA